MPDRAALTEGLNAAQREAVMAERGPLLVLAGAGTGKTRVVTVRIARLISRGVPADRILAVTFTNRAADEMQARLGGLLGGRQARRPQISTFHSLCVTILRRQMPRLGLPARFKIYASSAQRTLVLRVLREVRVPGALVRPDDVLRSISRWKSRGVDAKSASAQAATDRDHLSAIAYDRYQNALGALGAVDFDDLLLLAEQVLSQFPEARREESSRFDHVLIDEYQDTNDCQYRIVRFLAAPHRNLCVVGDDDQSIYSWRGAELSHILNFRKDWPEAQVVRLEQNYRSTSHILQWANRLILGNRNRHPKSLRTDIGPGIRPAIHVYEDEEQEAQEIVADVKQRLDSRACSVGDMAILFRMNEQSRPLEQALRRAGIPYLLVGSRSFFDRKEVQDVLAYLRVMDDPHDDLAWLRICNRPARGIGSSTARWLRTLAVQRGCSVWEVASQPEAMASLPESPRQAVLEFVELIQQFRRRLDSQDGRGRQSANEVAATSDHLAAARGTRRTRWATIARELVERVQYRREISVSSGNPDEAQRRWSAVEELLENLARHSERNPKETLGQWLNDLALRDGDFGSAAEEKEKTSSNQLRLMTLHAAKGLEFPVVYIVGLEEGILPHRHSIAMEAAAIEEERRLCYVGVTRARAVLILTCARARNRRGRLRPSHPSRFLYELTGRTQHPDYEAALRFSLDGATRKTPPRKPRFVSGSRHTGRRNP